MVPFIFAVARYADIAPSGIVISGAVNSIQVTGFPANVSLTLALNIFIDEHERGHAKEAIVRVTDDLDKQLAIWNLTVGGGEGVWVNIVFPFTIPFPKAGIYHFDFSQGGQSFATLPFTVFGNPKAKA